MGDQCCQCTVQLLPFGLLLRIWFTGWQETVPRSELTAAMRAILAVEHYGTGFTVVTVWSDSKIVVDAIGRVRQPCSLCCSLTGKSSGTE
eukprot:1099163-Karenia_brevis.AAC.1